MQAPIGPATTPELVAAVAGSGALGTLAASWTPAAELRVLLRTLRSVCDAPFCVNLVLAFEQRQRLVAALEEGATVISFSWGVDAELIALARDAQAFVFVQVGEVAAAEDAVRAGADALIVQGIEAGGHVQSTRPLLEFLREIRPQINVPLIAAGGLTDAASCAEARAAGADGCACGTVFLSAEEADVHPLYLERLIESAAANTVLTTVFDGSWPDAAHRVIRNDTTRAWESAGMPERGRRPGEGEQIASRNGHPVLRYDDAQPTRDTRGDVDLMAMYAGTSVRGITEREPASRIIGRLTSSV